MMQIGRNNLFLVIFNLEKYKIFFLIFLNSEDLVLKLFSVKLGTFLIKKTFARMDGCSTMSGRHSGVKKYFEESWLHYLYLHYRNQQPTFFFFG